MKNKLINKLFGKKLLEAMNELLAEYVALDYDEESIYKSLKGVNESVRVGMYLLTLEKNLTNFSYRINRVNRRLNDERKENFIKAYEKKEADKFLAMLGKGDKISLMSDLGIDVSLKERALLTTKERDYYKVISNSIMEDQEYDKRDGIDTFVKYKKEEKKA